MHKEIPRRALPDRLRRGQRALLMHAMEPNAAGVIGSAGAAGVPLSILG